jgi:hypothetical protein
MINEKYSFKGFMGQSLKGVPVEEFNNTEIKGSCFYQEAKETDVEVLSDIFPDGMVGVTFQRCNLDNVEIPAGNTIDGRCSNRKIKVQNDREDWVLSNLNAPIEPVDKKRFLQKGKSIDPQDIPDTPMQKVIN